ncbi:MAG: glycoside hydrolase family 31 protein, partial [Rikenellaceae bacterium]
IEVDFYTPTIVRVLKHPSTISELSKPNLSVTAEKQEVEFQLTTADDKIYMQSEELIVQINQIDGEIIFKDLANNVIVQEKPYGTTFAKIEGEEQNYQVVQNFLLDADETIYGLGQQQHGRMNQRDQTLPLVNKNTAICIPIIQSSRGYTIYWDQYSRAEISDSEQGLSMTSIGESADYYFMYGGSMKQGISKVRELTGQVPMFPLWTFGFFQSRERYKNQYEPVEVVKRFRELEIPIDCVIQDWQYWGEKSKWNSMDFDPTNYPEPQRMVDDIHKLNAKIMIVAWPGFGVLTPQYNEFIEKGMLLDFETYPGSGTRPYDPFNPEARDIYWSYLKKGLLSKGFDGWWLDSTEPDNSDRIENINKPTYLGPYKNVHNAFALSTVGGIYQNHRAENLDKRIFILTRSAFAGQQRYGANIWSGDVGSDFETLGRQIPAGLNVSMCGIPYWNTDIGGFYAYKYQYIGATKNPEFQQLYVRWLQFATFTPMMRSHGTAVLREIYEFGQRGDWAFDVQEKFINLRYSLLPYNYSTAWGVTNRGETFMKPLAVDFAEDQNVYDIGNQYMYGDAFLVAPVTEKDQVSKEVYLPKGALWYNFWDNTKYQGGESVKCAAPIDILPLFVKGGTILPWGPKVQYSTEKSWKSLDFKIYPGSDGRFILYEDENDSYNYENGEYSEIEFVWSDRDRTLTILDRRGSFKGIALDRKFNIQLIGGGLKSVKYSGKQISIRL